MGNHVHLLLKTGAETLGQVFRRIGARYVIWYNRKYGRIGHLFQDRYKSRSVESDEYLLSVTRYIHQNPVKASLAENAYLYKWSSASAYIDGGNSLVDAGFVLSLFSENAGEQLAAYKDYLQKDDDLEHLGESAKRLSDREAREIMNRLCGTSTVAEFQ